MPTKVKPYVTGDFLIREGFDREYDVSSVKVTNASSVSYMNIPAGQPFTGNAPTVAASINAFTGLVLEAVSIPPSGVQPVAILQAPGVGKGLGLVVDFNMLPTVDMVGAAITAATFKTQLNALGYVVYDEPPKQLIQTK